MDFITNIINLPMIKYILKIDKIITRFGRTATLALSALVISIVQVRLIMVLKFALSLINIFHTRKDTTLALRALLTATTTLFLTTDMIKNTVIIICYSLVIITGNDMVLVDHMKQAINMMKHYAKQYYGDN